MSSKLLWGHTLIITIIALQNWLLCSDEAEAQADLILFLIDSLEQMDIVQESRRSTHTANIQHTDKYSLLSVRCHCNFGMAILHQGSW